LAARAQFYALPSVPLPPFAPRVGALRSHAQCARLAATDLADHRLRA